MPVVVVVVQMVEQPEQVELVAAATETQAALALPEQLIPVAVVAGLVALLPAVALAVQA